VLEVSSFQLETTEAFRPEVAVVLNVSPDHLDRHGDVDAYARAKRLIVERQRPGDTAVLCFDDPIVAGFAAFAGGDVLPFRTQGPVPEEGGGRAAWLDTGAAVLRGPEGTRRLSLDSLRLAGRHNLENVVASLAALFALGADLDKGMEALAGFRGLPHRSERVAVVGGAVYINDSKATNPGAAMRALEGAGGKLIWIAGGRDKGLGYEALADTAARTAKSALLIGEAAEKLERAIGGRIACERLPDLPAAVRRAAALAEPGDVVLLAPACASFDQFESFEARGDCFRDAVLDLDSAEPADDDEAVTASARRPRP
jgi:UDP-N-acetylmuramoylalanine--D-glutamate ligase